MKETLLRGILWMTRMYIRYIPTSFGKMSIWHKICLPYINWRQFDLIVRTRAGHLIHCNTKDVIQAKIAFFGEWEPNLTAFLQSRLKPGDVFIDIGANIGYFSILAADLVGPDGEVLAVEASPSIYQRLMDNVLLNKTKNLRAVNIAASDTEGVLTIYAAGSENIGATTTLAERGYRAEGEVRCAPLTSIATTEELRRARIIKIDIEGAEAPVLENILKNINLFRRDMEIIAEISPDGYATLGRSVQVLLDEIAVLGLFPYMLPNDYRVAAYIEKGAAPAKPVRLNELPSQQFDLVISRQTADIL